MGTALLHARVPLVRDRLIKRELSAHEVATLANHPSSTIHQQSAIMPDAS